MDSELYQLLRCPLDPDRATHLTPDRDAADCQKCHVRFPIKQGLPVLIVAEAELPPGLTELSQLPCQRRANRRESRSG